MDLSEIFQLPIVIIIITIIIIIIIIIIYYFFRKTASGWGWFEALQSHRTSFSPFFYFVFAHPYVFSVPEKEKKEILSFRFTSLA